VPLLQVGWCVVADPDLGIVVLVNKNLQRKVERGAGSGQHDGCTRAWISEDEEFGRRHGHAYVRSLPAVIDEGEESDVPGGQDAGERVHYLTHGVLTEDASNAVSVFIHGVSSSPKPRK